MCDNQEVGTGELSIKAVNIKTKRDRNKRSVKNKYRRGTVQANVEKLRQITVFMHTLPCTQDKSVFLKEFKESVDV